MTDSISIDAMVEKARDAYHEEMPFDSEYPSGVAMRAALLAIGVDKMVEALYRIARVPGVNLTAEADMNVMQRLAIEALKLTGATHERT